MDVLPNVVKGNLQKCEENALPQLRAPEAQPALLHDVLMAESCPVVAHVGVSMLEIAICACHLFRIFCDLTVCGINVTSYAVNSGNPQLVDTLASGPSDAPTFNVIRCHSHESGAFLVLKADGEAFDAHMRPVHRSNFDCLVGADRHTGRVERIDAFGSPVDHLDPLNPDPAALSPVTAANEMKDQTENEGFIADVDQFSNPAGPFLDAPDMTDSMTIDQDVLDPLNQHAVENDRIDAIYDDDEQTDADDGGWLVLDPHDTSQNKDKPFRIHRPCIPKCDSRCFVYLVVCTESMQALHRGTSRSLSYHQYHFCRPKSELKQFMWQPFTLPELHAAAEDRLQLLLPGWGPAKTEIPAVAVVSEPVGAKVPGPALDVLGLCPNESTTLCDQNVLSDQEGHPWMEEHDGGIDCDAYDDAGDAHADRDWHGTFYIQACSGLPLLHDRMACSAR